jgi:chorismate-pyruvate lyase
MTSQFPRFAALPFVAIDDDVIAGTPVRCINERAAILCAQRLLTVFGNVGSVALRRSSVSGETLDVLQTFGDVPLGSELTESSLRKSREASIGH